MTLIRRYGFYATTLIASFLIYVHPIIILQHLTWGTVQPVFISSSFQTSDLSILKELKVPIFFVTGNHEYYLKDANKKLDPLQEYGIETLDNQNICLNNINIIGISDNTSDHEKIKYVQDMFKKDSFNFCIVHQLHCPRVF
jgi:Icc-related predicted phosphoesterase